MRNFFAESLRSRRFAEATRRFSPEAEKIISIPRGCA
jgi:hypothetical protein